MNAGLNGWETAKRFRIFPRELSFDTGELSPSLKVKSVISRNYAELMDDM